MEDQATTRQPSIEQVEALLIRTLRLEEVGVTKIDRDDALFDSGLGLDSIDALELALAISKEYGVSISSEAANIRQVFSSLNNLTAYIQAQRDA
jgi:acyl carrier protein